MIRKLLFFFRSLFSIFSNSSKEKSFQLSLKMFCLGMFFVYVNSVSGQIAQRGTFTTNTSNSSSTTLTITKPAGLVIGDIMIAQIMQSGNVFLQSSIADATRTGWIQIAGSNISTTSGNYSRATLLYKFADATDVAATNFSFSIKTNAVSSKGAIIAFSGVDNSNPFDGTPGTVYNNINNDNQLNANAITTTTLDSVILMFGAAHDNINFSNWTTTSTGTLSQIYSEPYNTTVDIAIGAAWGRKAVVGSTGGGTASLSASDPNGSILLALKAACVSNLITNGDFVSGAANWAVGTGGTLVETNPEDTYFSTGNSIGYTAELDAESSIRQTGIAVVPNVSYTVSFIYAQRPTAPTPTGVTVRVTGGGTFTSSGIQTSVRTPTVGTFTFTPTGTPITMDFYNSLNAGNTFGTIIDNIVLLPTSQVAPVAVTSGAGGSLNTATACAGTQVQLNVLNVPASGVTYAWTGSSGASFSSTTIQNPTVTFTGSGLQFARVIVTNTSSGCSGTPSTTYVNVLAAPTITTASTPAIVTAVCQSASAQTTTMAYNATTNNPTSYSIAWATLGNQGDTSFAFASGGGSITGISVPAGTSSGTYTGTMTIKNANDCTATQAITLTVVAVPVGPVIAKSSGATAGTVCAGTTLSMTVTTAGTGGTGTSQDEYRYNNGSGLTSWSTTIPSFTAVVGTNTIQSRRTSTGTGCTTATGNTLSWTVVAVPVGPVIAKSSGSASATACVGTTLSMTVSTAGTGGTGTSQDEYRYNNGSVMSAWSTTVPSFAAGAGTNTIESRRTSTGTGCTTALGNTLSWTVNPLPAITTQPQPLTICVGTGGSFTVATSASSPTYQWQYSTSTSGPWTNTDGNAGVSGHTTATLTLANTVPVSYSGYYLRCVITSNTCVNNSDPALLIVNALPTITTAANPAVVTATCVTAGATSTTMDYTSASGNPTAYSIAWTGLAAQGTTSNTFVAGGGSISGIVIPAGTAAGTYTGVMTIRNATTCTTTLNITLTVKQNYSAPTVGTITQPTCTTTTGSVVLTGLPATGNLFQNNGTTTVNVAITGTSTTVTGLAPGTYRFAVDNGCAVNYSANVVIAGSNTWNGSSWSYGRDPILSDAITFTGNYSLNADINACSCTVTNAAVVTIKTGKTMHIVNGVFVGTTSSLTFENNASLTQDNTSNTLNTGVISYIRDTYPIRQADYTYWSSPVKGQTLTGVSPNTEDDKYYSFTSPDWIGLDRSSVMTVGKGYIIRGPESFSNTGRAVYTATFQGIPNNGNIDGETALANKFYLVGNPYPSALDADEFIDRNDSFIEGTLYFWTHNTPVVLGGYYRYSADDYSVYNLSGGTGTIPAPSGTTAPGNNASALLGYIAAGQSFFAGTVQPGVFKFDNLMRAGQNHNSQFFKPGKTSKSASLEKNRMWINMANTEGAFKQILVGYIEGATNAYERKYDGITLDANKYIDFYSISDNKKLTIQGRGLPFADADIVPLGYRSAIAGDFTISIESADGTMETQTVYLEDKLTGAIHDLRASNYTFTTAIGTFSDRLVLRYTNKTLGTGDFENIENGIVVSSRDKAVQVFSSKENIQEVTIFDITGKLLLNKKKVGSTELKITDLQIGNQVLLVKVTLENGHQTSRKVIFQ